MLLIQPIITILDVFSLEGTKKSAKLRAMETLALLTSVIIVSVVAK